MDITPKRLWYLFLSQLYFRNDLALDLVARLPLKRLDRPIWVMGLPRSGTSIFSTMMGRGNRHLANWSEAVAVWDARHRDPEVDHRWTEAEATEARIRRVTNNFATYAKLKGCPRFMNKHPRNSLRIPFLVKGWPDAYFIDVRRDVRAVVNSLISESNREKWRRTMPLGGFAKPPGWREIAAIANETERFSRMAVEVHRILTDDLKRCVSPERLLEVRYEDFAQDLHGTLRRVYSFCEVEPDEEQLSGRVPARLENRNFKWAEQRSADDLEIMKRLLTPVLIETGYEPDAEWLARIPVRAGASA